MRNSVGLPEKPFFFTLDQIGGFLEMDITTLRKVLFYQDRSVGLCPKDRIKCINMAAANETPEWRVLDRDFIGYLRYKGIRYYSRGYLKSYPTADNS